jgi:membrane-bound lytic murein transglycosylase D
VLPGETKNYVPGIIAAIIMAKNPAQYGLDKLSPESAVVWDTVTVDYAIDLRLAADVTGASLQEIVALNPSLLRMTTPRDISFDLHLPVGTADVFAKRIKDIPEEKRTSWRFHIARAGETLDTIASAQHVRAGDIAETNGIAAGETVEEGDELVIPVASVASGVNPLHYTVRRGDTLVTVADRFSVSVEQLRRWNHLSSNAVKPGRLLTVAEPVKLAPGTRVRGKSAHSKGKTHTASSTAHATTTHAQTSHTHASRTSSTKKTTSQVKSSSSKSKSKATR